MRRIGTSEQNLAIVTLSYSELAVLKQLAKSAQGNVMSYIGMGRDSNWREEEENEPEFDIFPALNAVMEWIKLKNRANEIRTMADELDKALGPKVMP